LLYAILALKEALTVMPDDNGYEPIPPWVDKLTTFLAVAMRFALGAALGLFIGARSVLNIERTGDLVLWGAVILGCGLIGAIFGDRFFYGVLNQVRNRWW